MSAHTAAPWVVDASGLRVLAAEIEASETTAYRPSRELFVSHVDNIANTRLAAAAPDLLVALQEFVSGGHATGAPEWQLMLFEKARAAIAKATGGK